MINSRQAKLNWPMPMIFRTFIFLLLLSALPSCETGHSGSALDIAVSKGRLIAYQKVGTVSTTLTNCAEPERIVASNFPLGFDAMMQRLVDSLESQNINNDAERLLLLADFSFALLSSEFLYRINSEGSVPKDDDLAWEQASLRECYELANSNKIALNCGHRTSFFLKLLDTLMPRLYFTVSVKGKHTFPVVMAAEGEGLWMVVDPYDPFVVLDDSNKVMDIYSTIRTRQGHVFRTSRAFGPTRLLVSDSLLINLPKEQQQWCETVALWDSIVIANRAVGNNVSNKLSFDLASTYSVDSRFGFRYAVPDLGRPDTFNFKRFFHPLMSSYMRHDALAMVPLSMMRNEKVIAAVKRFNANVKLK